MADSVKQPGIEITQVITPTAVEPTIPDLVPCVVGPCFEVMEAVTNGVANSSAKVANLSYEQLPLSISPTDFPTNHASMQNISLDVDSVDATLIDGSGSLGNILLDKDPGTAFLADFNKSTRPGFVIDWDRVYTEHATTDEWPAGPLYITANNSLKTVNFEGTEDTPEKIVAMFKAEGLEASVQTFSNADALTVATHDSEVDFAYQGASNQVQLIVVTIPNTSANYGHENTLKIGRLGTSVSAVHAALAGSGESSKDFMIRGSGLYVDSNDSSKLAFSRGIYYRGNMAGTVSIDTLIESNWADPNRGNGSESARSGLHPCLLTEDFDIDNASTWTPSNLLIRTKFSSANTAFTTDLNVQQALPSRSGDLVYLNGVNVGQVTAVSSSFVKVGVVDTVKSTYTSSGSIINQRYIKADLAGTRIRNAYFVAQGLTRGSGTAASNTFNLNTLDTGFTTSAQASVTLQNATIDTNDSVSLQVAGTQLVFRIVKDGVAQATNTVVFSDNIETAAALVEYINNTNPVGVTAVAATKGVTLKSTEYGSNITLQVDSVNAGSTATGRFHQDITATPPVLIAAGTSFSATGTDATFGDTFLAANLTGKEGAVYIDGNSKEYTFVVSGNRALDLVDAINESVGLPIATYSNTTHIMTITSPSKGSTSKLMYANTSRFTILGSSAWSSSTATGTGRPDPNLAVSTSGVVHIGSNILRDLRTGAPVQSSNLDIHLSFKGLRLDVSTSPNSGEAGLVNVSSMATLLSSFSPLTPENPLGLALYYALLNAGDGTQVSCIGVDEVSASEPEGSLAAYSRAATFLGSHEVYCVVPLTSSEEVINVFNSHVNNLSLPANRAERVLISSPNNPTREANTTVASGTNARSTGTTNLIQLDSSPEQQLSSAGIDAAPGVVIPEASEIVLKITFSSSDVRHYSIKSVSGALITVRTSFESSIASSLYETQPLPSTLSFEGLDYVIYKRGASLTVPGTTMLDLTRLSTSVRDSAQTYNNRRQVRLFPDTVSSIIDGTERTIPSFFFGAAIAGDSASRPAQDPLTRRTLLGFTSVVGPDLQESQLDVIAAGNLILVNTSTNPIIRMQSTTSSDVIESREFSIVKAIDAFAKSLRSVLRNRIGQFNITQQYLDDTSLVVDAACAGAVNDGLLASASLDLIEQDANSPDTLNVSVSIGVLYPANYIKLTIVV